MNLRLNDLKNFVEMALCQTQTEAARKLQMTPPSLSESIKRLESDLGCILFYRTRTGISLTSTGRKLFEKAKFALQSIDEVGAMATHGKQFHGRSIVIGCHPVVASYVLPQALEELERSTPDYRVELKHGLSRHVQGGVQRGEIDIGIVINPSPVPDLVIRKLAIDEVGVWAINPTMKYKRLVCDPELFQSQSIMRAWKLAPKEIISSSSLELIARLTACGMGYGILPSRVEALLRLNLQRIPRTPTYSDSICLVYRPEFGKMHFEQHCLDALIRAIK